MYLPLHLFFLWWLCMNKSVFLLNRIHLPLHPCHLLLRTCILDSKWHSLANEGCADCLGHRNPALRVPVQIPLSNKQVTVYQAQWGKIHLASGAKFIQKGTISCWRPIQITVGGKIYLGVNVTSDFCGQWVVFLHGYFLALYYKAGCIPHSTVCYNPGVTWQKVLRFNSLMF